MGKPQFENQTMISAVGSSKVRRIIGSSTASIPTNGGESITIYSPVKTISRLFNVRLLWEFQASAASGEKAMVLDLEASATRGIGMLGMRGAHNKSQYYDQGYFYQKLNGSGAPVELAGGNGEAGEGYFPPDLGAVAAQKNAIRFDDTLGLKITMYHNVNIPVTSNREWILFLEEETVAR